MECSRNSEKVWALEQSEPGQGHARREQKGSLWLCVEKMLWGGRGTSSCLLSPWGDKHLGYQDVVQLVVTRGGKVSNSRCVHILKVEQAEFADDLNLGYGRKKGIKDGCNALA